MHWFRLAARTGHVGALARLSALGYGPVESSGTIDSGMYTQDNTDAMPNVLPPSVVALCAAVLEVRVAIIWGLT